MRALRLLLPILIAVLFAGSGLARAMPSPAAEPPCHMTGMDGGGEGHAPVTPKAPPLMASMGCCAACLTPLAEAAAPPPPITRAALPAASEPLATPDGRTPAPEPEPPRTVA